MAATHPETGLFLCHTWAFLIILEAVSTSSELSDDAQASLRFINTNCHA